MKEPPAEAQGVEEGEAVKEELPQLKETVKEQRVKPWSCARVDFRVLAPRPNGKRGPRRKELKLLKAVAAEGVTSTPYVSARWADGTTTAALLDTGAQWSLLSQNELSKEEQESLAEVNGMTGRGVSGERIPVMGEVWRDVTVGNLLFEHHRFIVVQTMICDVILGIDFCSRSRTLAFDFNSSVMILNETTRVKLYHHPKEIEKTDAESEEATFSVETKESCIIPGRSEMTLLCTASGTEKGKEYMIEPVSATDSLVSTPYGLIEGGEDLYLRIANVGQDEVCLDPGQLIAVAQSGKWVRNVRAGVGLEAKGKPKKGSGIDVDSMIGMNLEANKKSQLKELVLRYSDIFYQGGKLPIVNVGVEHSVEVEAGKGPSVFKPRRLSRELEKEVKDHVQDLLDKGVIRQSNSKWAAPIVCARKKDGSLRMAIDYRSLNSKSHTATLHPIPLIDDLLDRLADAKYFAVLDAKSGYHQMPLKQEDSEKTAFVVPWGHYEFAERTPFGLKGAGYSFQRMMSTMLGTANFEDALCYLDDVLVWGETWEVFMRRLRKVMDKVRAAGLSLGAGKCKIGVEEVSYLGCTIKHGMVKISEQRVEQIRGIERPENVRGLRSALGAFSYVQRWIPGLAELAKPLFSAITDKPYARLKWSAEMDKAFQVIKNMIADSVSLNLPHMDKRFTIVTDCSKYAAGAMLAQEDERMHGYLKPVAFFHHTLSKPEQNFSATERELLAVVLGVKKYRVYLGKGFNLITDHQALRWLKSLDPDNETGRRGRWLDFLQQFDMTITHKKGKSPEMSIADFLSRVTCSGEVKGQGGQAVEMISAALKSDDSSAVMVSKEEILAEQNKCPVIRLVKKAIVENTDINPGGSEAESWRKPSLSEDNRVKELWRLRDRLIIDADGVLRLQFNGGKRTMTQPYGVKVRNRIIVPQSYTDRILVLVHRSPTAAHMGSKRTWQRARNSFWWPKMRQEIEEYVAQCEECGKNKHMNHPNSAPANRTSIPGQPLEMVMIDFVGPFQAASTHSFRYVLQIQDVFSRYILFVPTVDALATTAVEAMMDRWISLFGVPKSLRSDRGPHFIAEVFAGMCTRAGIKQKLGSPEHPQSQAQVERQNQLVNNVRCVCENKAEGWPSAIMRVQFSHNAAVNATTGFSPARLILGRELKLPEDLLVEDGMDGEPQTTRIEERDRDHQVEIDEARQRIADEQDRRVEEQEERPRSRSHPYVVGDIVRYRLNDDARSRLGGKIAPRYSEPYVITEQKENGFTYEMRPVSSDSRGRPKIRHFNTLKTVSEADREDIDVLDQAEEVTTEVAEEESRPPNVPAQDTESTQIVLRRSGRERRQATRLQVDGKRKVYTEVSIGAGDGDSNSEHSEGDS